MAHDLSQLLTGAHQFELVRLKLPYEVSRSAYGGPPYHILVKPLELTPETRLSSAMHRHRYLGNKRIAPGPRYRVVYDYLENVNLDTC